MFGVAFLFLSVHYSFWWTQDQYDRTWCRKEYAEYYYRAEQLANWWKFTPLLLTPEERDVKTLEYFAKLAKAEAALNARRLVQRGRMLRWENTHRP